MTAKERGDEVLRAAVQAFAAAGYEGTKTDEIARLAGVSQPYVIRLFGTKQQLFLAAVDSVCLRIEQIFREAAT
ncbi:MAG: TetR/AcrR family transcriptional regulator, partial [Kribbellaceae bacterium]|nr:TetR/AcrR family transcriptional regulator [Kribbellaceae bacterium]